MKSERTQMPRTPNRREFLQAAGVGAASLAAAGVCLTQPPALAQQARPQAGPNGKRPIRLGLASYTLRKFDLDETLKMTQRVGLKYVCFKSMHLPLDSSAKQIAETVAKVKEAGLTLYGGGVITMRNEDQVNQAFDYAKAAGMTTIVGVPMPDVLPLVNKRVQQYDIAVAIHNHGPGDKTYPTPQSVYEKVKGLDKRIGLCIDIGHTLRVGADPIADARRYADRLLDVHLKDVSAASPKGGAIEAGRGVIDLPRFLKTLIKINYSGIASLEYEKDAADPLPGLAESVGYVNGVLDSI